MDNVLLEKLLRQFLQLLAGILVANGWMSSETATLVIGILVSAAVAGWMTFRNATDSRIADMQRSQRQTSQPSND